MIRDAFLYVALLFAVGLAILIVFVIFDSISIAIQDSPDIDATNQARMAKLSGDFPTTWDYTFLTVMVAVLMAVLILSWVVASNPAMFFAFLILVTILGGFAGYLANAFDEIILDPIMGASAANFPIMSFILSNYMIFVIGTVFLMLMVFFAKPNEGN